MADPFDPGAMAEQLVRVTEQCNGWCLSVTGGMMELYGTKEEAMKWALLQRAPIEKSLLLAYEAGKADSVSRDSIVDVAEIARRLKLRRVQVVHTWIRRGKFPEPARVLRSETGKALRLWDWAEVDRWYQTRKKRGSGGTV